MFDVLLVLLDVQQIDERLDGAALHEDGEQDDDESGRDEHLSRPDLVGVEHFDQREADGAAKSAVRHDELLLQIDGFQAEFVCNERQHEHACSPTSRRKNRTNR